MKTDNADLNPSQDYISPTRIFVSVGIFCGLVLLAWAPFQSEFWQKLMQSSVLLWILVPATISALAAVAAIILPLFTRLEPNTTNCRRLLLTTAWALPVGQVALGLTGLVMTLLILRPFVDISRQLGFFTTQHLAVIAWAVAALLLPAGASRLIRTGWCDIRNPRIAPSVPNCDARELAFLNFRKVISIIIAITLPVFVLCACAAVAKIIVFWLRYIMLYNMGYEESFLIPQFVAPLVGMLMLFSPVFHLGNAFGWDLEPNQKRSVPYRLGILGIISVAMLALISIGGIKLHNYLVSEKLASGVWRPLGPAKPVNELYPMYETVQQDNRPSRIKWTPPTPDGRTLMTEVTRFGSRLWAVDMKTSNARLLSSNCGILQPIIDSNVTPYVREDSNIWLNVAPVSFAILQRYPDFVSRRIDTVTGRATVVWVDRLSQQLSLRVSDSRVSSSEDATATPVA